MNRVYPTLVRRELWEHRWLWLAPLVTAGILIAMTAIGVFVASSHMGGFTPWRGGNMPGSAGMPLPGSTQFPAGMQFGLVALATQLFFVASLVVVFYLHDCLYAERKDRSILFWKSLPVSDVQTVISKFGLAMLILPLGTFVVATLTYPIIYAITALGLPGFAQMTGGWSIGAWLQGEGTMLGALVATMLWYAPVFAWFMLASVVSTRSTPYQLSILPVLVLGVCEGLILHTSYVWKFVFARTVPLRDLVEALQRPSLWIGLAVAAGMLYIVIRLRRYRDDT